MKIIQFLHGNKIGGMESSCLELSSELSLKHDVMLIADPVFKPYCHKNILFLS